MLKEILPYILPTLSLLLTYHVFITNEKRARRKEKQDRRKEVQEQMEKGVYLPRRDTHHH